MHGYLFLLVHDHLNYIFVINNPSRVGLVMELKVILQLYFCNHQLTCMDTDAETYNCFSCWFTKTMFGAGMAGSEGLHHIKFFMGICARFCIVPLMLLFHRESIATKCHQSYDTKSVLCR
ncbi:hypothetical protein SETIT_8G108800v2 [Setaria italica]|uniref:Uncharacterized protein n=2 Tax=Setaria TaxID=4554 RepID=A0A368S6L5_SETIT|nr:hypothetical protein SETIT_8G108800v2 [Setaria italica]TKW14983.1 hypothetical protein SEVIR_5G202500v2 [Setaria viridis]